MQFAPCSISQPSIKKATLHTMKNRQVTIRNQTNETG